MRKGQAFSTFKLMIAAVVAVAILGILLSILGGITSPVGFEEQAESLLRDVSGGGSIQRGPEVSFTEGSIYSGSAGTSLSAVVGGRPVNFKCGVGFCSPGETDEWGTQLEIEHDGRASLIACCEENECYLGIGDVDISAECL